MKKYVGYIRVSTPRQGEKGVSLQEQKEAIERYASRQRLTIVEWFEERTTAAKRGRRVFTQMMRLLTSRKVAGVVCHKIDRSARNLADWADLGELIDRGVEVHFAGESLDLQSRGGRLSADIQAVVAADFIRNLREETRKGLYGRLKQGLYPLGAPIGYLDAGAGKPKVIDPVRGPLIRETFELYATGTYSLEALCELMKERGLRKKTGAPLTIPNLSYILNNPFYFGLIKLRSTGETFWGIHEPLVSKALFDNVRRVLRGKIAARTKKHEFMFRRLLRCKHCGYALIGEERKGHVYYRCHTRTCPTTCLREERVLEAVQEQLRTVLFTPDEKAYCDHVIHAQAANWLKQAESTRESLSRDLGNVKARILKLTDAFLDGTIEKELFEERKEGLLLERKELEEKLERLGKRGKSNTESLAGYLEEADSLYLRYLLATPEERRELIHSATSNLEVDQKDVVVKLSPPFCWVAERSETMSCAPSHNTPRTIDAGKLDSLLSRILEWHTTEGNYTCEPPPFPSPSV